MRWQSVHIDLLCLGAGFNCRKLSVEEDKAAWEAIAPKSSYFHVCCWLLTRKWRSTDRVSISCRLDRFWRRVWSDVTELDWNGLVSWQTDQWVSNFGSISHRPFLRYDIPFNHNSVYWPSSHLKGLCDFLLLYRSGGQGGKAPSEAETLFAFERSMEATNWPIFFWNLETQKITTSYRMQSHMAILIAYCIGMKKDHQTLLNFAILARFHLKSPVKNFHGRVKGWGIAPCPLNMPLVKHTNCSGQSGVLAGYRSAPVRDAMFARSKVWMSAWFTLNIKCLTGLAECHDPMVPYGCNLWKCYQPT